MTYNELIYKALKEYEENHYEMENEEWQEKMNELLIIYKNKENN